VSSSSSRPLIGWREWLILPDLGISAIKAKIDTGARSSALHAIHIQPFDREGRTWLRFQVHPVQRDSDRTITAEAPLLEERLVRNSGGHAERRPVIQTHVVLNGDRWPIDLTLTNRDVMGFRMLLGRQAVHSRFWIDPSRSFLQSASLQSVYMNSSSTHPTQSDP
jgi:hypothetical protein